MSKKSKLLKACKSKVHYLKSVMFEVFQVPSTNIKEIKFYLNDSKVSNSVRIDKKNRW